jgi:hypothetical protein
MDKTTTPPIQVNAHDQLIISWYSFHGETAAAEGKKHTRAGRAVFFILHQAVVLPCSIFYQTDAVCKQKKPVALTRHRLILLSKTISCS